ncbi:MAG: hypothetical protein WAS36_02765 [Candidatus Saccharimonadales bacterium]
MNYITDRHHNFDNGYIALCDLQLKGLPREIVIDGENLPVQTEHHISLICTKRLVPLLTLKNSNGVEQEFITAFLEFEAQQHITEYEVTNEFFVVEKDDRKSIVVKCNVPYLDELFQSLNDTFEQDFPKQVAHITLFARNNAGIGLISDEELARIAKPINLPELSELRKAFE